MKKTKEKPTAVIISAIAGLVVLECFAISNGINGTLLKIVIALVAGLGGFIIPSPIQK